MSIHYQSINGLEFSAFQRRFSIEKISTFVSYLMMHLNVDSLAFQGLAEQLRTGWLWRLGQAWNNFICPKLSGVWKLRQRWWQDWGSAETFVPRSLIQIHLVANMKWDFQDGTWWTSVSESKLYNRYKMGLCWQLQQRSEGFDIPEHQTLLTGTNPFI